MKTRAFDALRRALIVVHVVLTVGGVMSYAGMGGAPPDGGWAAPAYLASAGLLALAVTPRAEWPALLGGGAIGWVAEAAGVAWGVPFGVYRYTAALGPAVAGVPVVMAAAWMVLLAYVRQWGLRPWTAAVALTALDLVIDPLAAGPLSFWVWERAGPYHGVPLVNYGGWLLVSAALMAWSSRWPCARSPGARWLGRSVLGFFTALAALLQRPGPAVTGLGLLALEALLDRRAADQFLRNRRANSPASQRPPSAV
ncbi:MAG: carotenoid biosynthesis protein [Kiritimatiellae bacterium]|nr:carotenoid biosynthesis protein [Kiritimatiellia bacterium]